ncbi:HvfC family RiPP maturation protein [Microbulbifer zhoushanensis]|uniref:HvfC family RiPP maturation protein n=1 Tax=Microbulbifer zhoushanensis TaxID=2904254 RepID=UPI001F45DAB1|nr:putative DNA-binding domain-containing protein [Microbulbifer zhoushanensis]
MRSDEKRPGGAGRGPHEAHFAREQRQFAAHLRNPLVNEPPADIEDRRMAIYRDLIYNNIESFIASGFPVLRSIYTDDAWHTMVREFVHRHASRSPYFLQISEEFLQYLQEEHVAQESDPPFLLELAHYEWVELALDVNPAEPPPGLELEGDVLAQVPVVSPVAWSLSYRFPVHMIGPTFQPSEPPDNPTFLLVYRNREDEVGFMEINAVTARLLQLAQAGNQTGRALLEDLAVEMNHGDTGAVVDFGQSLLQQLLQAGVIAGLEPRR